MLKADTPSNASTEGNQLALSIQIWNAVARPSCLTSTLRLVPFVVLSMLVGGLEADAETPRPNIIYFVMEDASREDFGIHGAHIPTPNIDSLARQGIRFRNAWVASNNCSPSRGAFYTGQYAHHNGLIGLSNRGWSLAPDQRTIVDSLNEQGYETVLCGKQHERRALPGDKPAHRSKAAMHRYDRSICEKSTTPPRTKPHGIDHLLGRIQLYLADRKPDAPPFFMYVAPFEAHNDWVNKETIPWQPPIEKIQLPPYLPQVEWLKEAYRRYLGAVLHLDDRLGDLLTLLAEQGLEENTVFVFTTDHGADFRRAKGTLYEAGIGVPLMIRWKGVIEPGRVSDALINNIDLMPTLVEIAGGGAESDVDGRSFVELLRGKDYEESRYLFSEHNYHTTFRPMRALRDRRHKLIVNYSVAPDRLNPEELEQAGGWANFEYGRKTKQERALPLFELYDLQQDPHETRNLAASPEHRDVLLRLRDELYTRMRATGDPMKGAFGKVYHPSKATKQMSD